MKTPRFLEMIFREKLGKKQKMEIPNFFGEATVGVGFEYVLLRSCSLLIFEQILQNKVSARSRVRYGDDAFNFVTFSRFQC